jgi:FKBP-type peptidyl-prolyl cis-trans isomerase FklB
MRADEEDPNGPEAGTRFLAENRKKKDVIACSSGLQYRVIKEGDGLVRPGLDTKCACHYVGALLDGTQFDSSYEKGRPSTFRPDQVIKGWTEAMTLMATAGVRETVDPAVP